jgi:branched-chain amino acid transport system permease protein
VVLVESGLPDWYVRRRVVERLRQGGVARLAPSIVAGGLVVFAIVYVLVIATPDDGTGGSWRTTNFGSAFDDPGGFLQVLLDALTFAGLLFIVASGFSLIFGLMRVVNMAHGSFYLLGGYIAYEVQQSMTGEGFSIAGSEVNTWEWVLPLIVAAGFVGIVGLVVQQVLLSWNQGQDLRQALITIAVSVIIADQVIAHFPRTGVFEAGGGNAVSMTWPGWTERFVDLQVWNVQYSLARLVMLALGVAVGILLYLWLYRTKTGMVIRAGVDDSQMTSAMGINIQKTFAIAFVVGAALAGMGAVVGSSQGNIASGQDTQWLLNSLIVVIIGGMGSLLGAAAGSLLYALVLTFSASYLPIIGDECCTNYSIVLTFALLAIVLAYRPQGLFRRAG